jgi:M6 family metalloprotease-like protein
VLPSLYSAPLTETNEGTTNLKLGLDPRPRLRAVMLFVDFPDLRARESTSTIYAHLVPRARAWFDEVSYGHLQLDVTPVRRWFRMPSRVRSYGLADGVSGPEQHVYLRDAVKAADSRVDFAGYQVIYVVAAKGTGAERSPAFLDYPGGGIDADGNELRYGATFFEDTKLDARYAANVLIHETGHVLGLPDLYDVPDPRYWSLFRFAGGWDVMSWNDPGFHFLAWEKWKLGWLEPPQIACLDGAGTMTATVTPLERAGGLKAIVLPVGPLLCTRDRSPSPNRPGPMALRRRRPSLHGRRVGTKRLRPCAYPSRGAGPELESPRPLRSALQRPALPGTWVATLANRADGISVTVLGSGPTGYRVRVSRT